MQAAMNSELGILPCPSHRSPCQPEHSPAVGDMGICLLPQLPKGYPTGVRMEKITDAFRHTSPSSGLEERACVPKNCLFLKWDSLVYLFVWSGTVSRGQCGSAHTQVEVGAEGLLSGRGGNFSWICWFLDFSNSFQLSRPFEKKESPKFLFQFRLD